MNRIRDASSRARPWWLSGFVALSALFVFAILPLMAVIVHAGNIPWSEILGNRYFQRVIRFSFYQATLSTLISISLAIPLAIALSHHRRFPGRGVLTTVFSLSLVIPTIIAIYGIVAVFGGSGWVSQSLSIFSIEPLPFYGLTGILIAHVFFNMPMATRVFLQSLEHIPSEQWRLAHQLGIQGSSTFRLIEWPRLRGHIAGLSVLIFTLCFTSFAIVMTLGGGPRATTIEVAIFQALRFDFDIPTAVALACIQLLICLSLTLLSTVFKTDHTVGLNIDRHDAGNSKNSENTTDTTNSPDTADTADTANNADTTSTTSLKKRAPFWRSKFRTQTNAPYDTPIVRSAIALAGERILIVLATLFIMSPLLALLLAGFNDVFLSTLTDKSTLKALVNSTIVAIAAASISLVLSLSLLFSSRHLRIRLRRERSGIWLQLCGNIILILPPLVLGTGLFLLLKPFADVFSIALFLIVIINSLMALPFLLRILDGPIMQSAKTHDRLVQSLGIYGWNRWRYIDWPTLKKPVGFGLALAATLSVGDLGTIALFGSDKIQTLPYLLYQRMGSYRLDEAAVTASILLLLCLVLFFGLQKLTQLR